MITLYSDDKFPGTNPKYAGKTIGQIMETSDNPKGFVKAFNAKNSKYCISDEVMVDTKSNGHFQRKF